MGRKPRAPLRRISSAESDQSRLEVSTTAGAASSSVIRVATSKPSPSGKLDVEQDDIGAQPARLGDRGLRVGGLADHLIAVGLQQQPCLGAKPGVVVDDEDGLRHGPVVP